MLETFRDMPGSDNDDYIDLPSQFLLQRLRNPDVLQRFWSKVDRSNPVGCWLWTSNLVGRLHHGQFHVGRFSGRLCNEYAHRVMWMLTNGPIPAGMQINHHCDVPACVNPDHLYLGTQADNMRDASERHRFPLTRKPKKLTDQCVRAIRVLAEGGVQQVLIARAFEVTKGAISQIVNGVRRIHVSLTRSED